jgi:hypothetical protein
LVNNNGKRGGRGEETKLTWRAGFRKRSTLSQGPAREFTSACAFSTCWKDGRAEEWKNENEGQRTEGRKNVIMEERE